MPVGTLPFVIGVDVVANIYDQKKETRKGKENEVNMKTRSDGRYRGC